jgi:acyl-CoA reductase-like NAD-dependent aldehyde dehydrogenase
MYERFVDRMVDAVASIRIGDPRDPGTEMGALAFRSHFDRVRAYIQIGLDQGATLAAGGGIPEGLKGGYFVEPTIFTNVDRSMRIANEEIFGPVVALMRWSSEDELIALANSVEYGLTARIACGNVGPGMKLARELEAGRMWINVANGGPVGMPFGGFKHSGIGKTGDFESLQSFTREKSISIAL